MSVEISGGGGPGLVRKSVVTLSDAQIKTLPTTPQTLLVATPNTMNLIVNVSMRLTWFANYTNINAAATLFVSNLPILDESVVGAQVSQLLANGQNKISLSAGPCDFNLNGTILHSNPTFIDANLINAAISLNMTNGASGNLTGGNPSNSLRIVTYYVPTSL